MLARDTPAQGNAERRAACRPENSNPPRTALAEGAACLTHSGGGELNAHPVIAELRWHPDGLDVVLSSPVAQRLSVHLRWPGRMATQVSPTMAVEVELRPDAPFLEQTFATLAYFRRRATLPYCHRARAVLGRAQGRRLPVDFHQDASVLHLLEVRRALGSAAAELAAVLMSDADALMQHFDALSDDPDIDTLVAYDLEFHHMIAGGRRESRAVFTDRRTVRADTAGQGLARSDPGGRRHPSSRPSLGRGPLPTSPGWKKWSRHSLADPESPAGLWLSLSRGLDDPRVNQTPPEPDRNRLPVGVVGFSATALNSHERQRTHRRVNSRASCRPETHPADPSGGRPSPRRRIRRSPRWCVGPNRRSLE